MTTNESNPMAEMEKVGLSVNPLVAKLRLIALFISLIVVFQGVLVLLGWVFESSILKSTLPGFIEMKTNAALGFVLAGAALFLQLKTPIVGRQQTIARLLAVLTVIIGVLTLAEYLFNFNLGIDQLLFDEPSGAFGGLLPNRMGVPAAISLTL
ncbi:MAG TPA: hypothetical protein VHO69_15935 [Phototrophicaceae bacterium]|nr:hypothetical protein [Phototrophicaceae bacterium]